MLRTTCFAGVSPVTNTWIASTDPLSVAAILTDTTSVSDAISSSARCNGSTEPAIGEPWPLPLGCGIGVNLGPVTNGGLLA